MNEVLDHYDRFSFLVDLFRDWPYREARAAAIEELRLEPGDSVIDLSTAGPDRAAQAVRNQGRIPER